MGACPNLSFEERDVLPLINLAKSSLSIPLRDATKMSIAVLRGLATTETRHHQNRNFGGGILDCT